MISCSQTASNNSPEVIPGTSHVVPTAICVLIIFIQFQDHIITFEAFLINGLSLFHIAYSIFAIYLLIRYYAFIYQNRTLFIVPLLYTGVLIYLLIIYRSTSFDVRFLIRQIYFVYVYLGFTVAFLTLRTQERVFLGKSLFFILLLSLLISSVISYMIGSKIVSYNYAYANFCKLLVARLKFNMKNYNNFASYLFFIGIILISYVKEYSTEHKKESFIVVGIYILLCIGAGGRYMPFTIIILLLACYYGVKTKRISRTLLCSLIFTVFVSFIGLMSTFYSIFPVTKTFPYINLKNPSLYYAVHDAYWHMFTAGDILDGDGYKSSLEKYQQFRDDSLLSSAIESYDLPLEGIAKWNEANFPPHSTYLIMLCSGGIIWTIFWIIWMIYPIFLSFSWTSRDTAKVSTVFIFCCLVIAYFSNLMHREWYVVGISFAHSLMLQLRLKTSI
ncbi:MAG: hypothetical protein CVU57_11915 [Deltaproteobacteria bacterium HGW-Deltaproteobacteria-15]|nr:MAG: hypothetical protein CVU57_11915 [Deltaproteobacteria bacterium HGW-Deltaproteobacteria-15]